MKFKKFIAGLVAGMCVFSSGTIYSSVGANNLKLTFGDPTGDSRIDAIDASMILANYAAFSTEKKTPTDEDYATSDINKDNKIDSVDASIVLSYYAFTSTNSDMAFEDYIVERSKPVATTTATTTTAVNTTTTTTTKRNVTYKVATTKEKKNVTTITRSDDQPIMTEPPYADMGRDYPPLDDLPEVNYTVQTF